MAELEVRVQQGQDIRRLLARLRELEDGKEIRKRLRRELKESAKPMVPAVQRAVLALPSKGQSARAGRPSLRARVARATQIRVRASGTRPGVTVWINPRRMPEGQKNLPAYMEGIRPFHRWRHPVFGDEDVFVQQPPKPFFYRAVRPLQDEVSRAGTRIINDIQREIEGR